MAAALAACSNGLGPAPHPAMPRYMPVSSEGPCRCTRDDKQQERNPQQTHNFATAEQDIGSEALPEKHGLHGGQARRSAHVREADKYACTHVSICSHRGGGQQGELCGMG